MYREQTRNFLVEVEPQFLPERSSAQAGYFYFSYRVRITNQGESAAKLLSRHWIITDAENKVQEVRGQGVVGEQPLALIVIDTLARTLGGQPENNDGMVNFINNATAISAMPMGAPGCPELAC